MSDSANGNVLSLENLSQFEFKRVLSDSPDRKLIFVEGSFKGKDSKAVLILEKKAFDESNVKALCSVDSSVVEKFVNDVYYNYECFPKTELNGE